MIGWWREWLTAWGPPLLLVGASLAVWEGLTQGLGVPRWLLPPPTAIAQELVRRADLLARHAWITIQEVIFGFGVALCTGIASAVAIAHWRVAERALYPLVVVSQTIPIIAIAPLLLIWVGYDLPMKVIVVAIISFFPITVNTVDGLRSVDPDLVNLLRTMGARRWQVFSKVSLPWALPYLFSGAKVAATVSVIGAVIGEWVGASAGLGWLMTQAVPRFQTPLVFAILVVLGGMGIALFQAVVWAERLCLPWHYSMKREEALKWQSL
ncbi:MAG: ABC transporter permease [Dehalococcoidia bacterium]|nr:ABC transporter permease [Dehalococcoidia bacterium]MDW8119148.1 ABC transporter permease [Chloroflexota bacterium]